MRSIERRHAETITEGGDVVVLRHDGNDTASNAFRFVARRAEETVVGRQYLAEVQRTATLLIAGVADAESSTTE